MTSTSLWSAAACVAIALTFAPVNAEAAITSVAVNTTRQYENARGYTYAEVTVQGSVTRADGSAGLYSVPAVVIYPRHHRGNRVGIVDWINGAYYHFFPATTEFGTFQFTLLATGNDLFEQDTRTSRFNGTRRSPRSSPAAPLDGRPHNHLVYGSIDRSADAWEILLTPRAC